MLTSDRILNRFQITLLQSKARNNSEKLKHEIDNFFESFKKLAKQSTKTWLVLFKNWNIG